MEVKSLTKIYIFLEEGSYYEGNNGGDPFVSGDLEINNEGYNNPAVLVGLFYEFMKNRKS
jgi:hypothetical protein